MIKSMLIMTYILALSLLLGLTGCNQAELKTLEAELAQNRQERNQLQKEINELTLSHDQLNAQVAEQDKLQEQIDELTKSRDAAVAEVKAARIRIEELTKSQNTSAAEKEAAKLRKSLG